MSVFIVWCETVHSGQSAERLCEVGTPYSGHWDGRLTPTEIKIIQRFIPKSH